MTPLKVGRNYLFVDQIESIVTPSPQGGQSDAALIRYASGREDTFQGAEAEEIRTWLARQLEPPTVPFVSVKSAEPKPAQRR